MRTQTQYSKLRILYPAGHGKEFPLLHVLSLFDHLYASEYDAEPDFVWAAKMLSQAQDLRSKYVYIKPSLQERHMAEPIPDVSPVRTFCTGLDWCVDGYFLSNRISSRWSMACITSLQVRQVRAHILELIGPDLVNISAICANDGDQIATAHCEQCDTNYCRDCDTVLHRNPQKRAHKRQAIKGASLNFVWASCT